VRDPFFNIAVSADTWLLRIFIRMLFGNSCVGCPENFDEYQNHPRMGGYIALFQAERRQLTHKRRDQHALINPNLQFINGLDPEKMPAQEDRECRVKKDLLFCYA
jgi:hypothetical protein